MKRLIQIIASTVFVALFLIGCGSNNSSGNSNASSNNSSNKEVKEISYGAESDSFWIVGARVKEYTDNHNETHVGVQIRILNRTDQDWEQVHINGYAYDIEGNTINSISANVRDIESGKKGWAQAYCSVDCSIDEFGGIKLTDYETVYKKDGSLYKNKSVDFSQRFDIPVEEMEKTE